MPESQNPNIKNHSSVTVFCKTFQTDRFDGSDLFIMFYSHADLKELYYKFQIKSHT